MVKITKPLLLMIVIVLFLFTAGLLNAAPINWNESTDGDLSHLNIFDLDVGLNTFIGSHFYDTTLYDPTNPTTTDSSYDIDGFHFNLATGLQLDSVTYEMIEYHYDQEDTIPWYGRPWYGHALFDLRIFPHDTLLESFRVIFREYTVPLNFFVSTLPIGAGSYLFDESEICVSIGHAWYVDYHLTFNVSASPVPEPATFILLGSGLAGLAFYRRKRK